MKPKRAKRRPAFLAMAIGILSCVFTAAAQEPVPNSTPTLNADSGSADIQLGLNSRIWSNYGMKSPSPSSRLFGFIPNYATVEGAASEPTLTTGGKFKLTLEGAFDPYEFAIVGALAAVNQAQDQDPSYGQGFRGYSKRYAKGFADQAIGNVMSGAVFPSVLREDPRFYQRGRGSFLSRFDYALNRMFVTRTDSGGMQFNYSEFVGNAAAAGISTLYEPASDRTLSNTLNTWETQLAIDVIAYEAKEFWPDIRRKVFHRQ